MANGKSSVTVENGEVLLKDGRLIAGGASLALGDISSMKIRPKQDGRFILPLIGVWVLSVVAGLVLISRLGLHEALEYDDIYIIAVCCALVAVVMTARHK